MDKRCHVCRDFTAARCEHRANKCGWLSRKLQSRTCLFIPSIAWTDALTSKMRSIPCLSIVTKREPTRYQQNEIPWNTQKKHAREVTKNARCIITRFPVLIDESHRMQQKRFKGDTVELLKHHQIRNSKTKNSQIVVAQRFLTSFMWSTVMKLKSLIGKQTDSVPPRQSHGKRPNSTNTHCSFASFLGVSTGSRPNRYRFQKRRSQQGSTSARTRSSGLRCR